MKSSISFVLGLGVFQSSNDQLRNKKKNVTASKSKVLHQLLGITSQAQDQQSIGTFFFESQQCIGTEWTL